MTFDNSKTIINLRIWLFFATILLIAWIIVVFVAKMIPFPLLGLSETAWTLILVGIYLIILFFPMILSYQYVWFSDDEEHIVIRYFFAGMVGGKKNSVSINKRTFAGYKYEKKKLGLDKSIILYQKIGQGIAKYPPIHISALSGDQKQKLFSLLDQYSPKA
ncbi:MAG: hypothetical protein MUE74_01210 [Bacteroidales bacterium]|jgi:hypothetical protein|nr:hypothetical protein [Bacteroidales bacterium]